MKKELVFVEERKREITEYVLARGKATVAELCERFGVSSATIRSDLRDLEQGGFLERTHGGAIVRGQARFEPDAMAKEVQRLTEKRAIAARALEHIGDGDTIILDTGSTTLELARLLSARNDITVLTNDLAIAMRLEEHPSATVHVLGGTLRRRFHCTVGPRAEDYLAGLTVDKAFLGANAFSLEKGASTPDIQMAGLKRRMISIARKVYLLVDSSKFGRDSFACFAAPGSIDTIITDALDLDTARALEELGVEAISVSDTRPRAEGAQS